MKKFIHTSYFKTEIGELLIASFEGKICVLDFRYRKMRAAVDKRIKKILNADFTEEEDDVIRETKKQVNGYLQGKRKKFDVPILMAGSDFQKQVWQALMAVPYGKTESYMELAKKIGNSKAVRAVAAANGANAISLIIPCHRIIESNGGLGGYGGGLPAKKKLLKLEKNNS